MPEGNKPFVVTDRRKFTMEGEPRPDADPSPERTERAAVPPAAFDPAAAAATEQPAPMAQARPEPTATPGAAEADESREDETYPPLTEEQVTQSKRAYEATAERIETAFRATNPGVDHPPAMNFEQLVQSVYLTAIMQLGGATPEGEQPRVDLLGARSSIDMMGVLAEKTAGNLTETEQHYLDNALFELRMGFLEMTQALARSAQSRAGTPGAAMPGGPGAPTLVR